MVEELCDLGPGVLGRLPDGAEDVIDALCTFQAEGMDGLSDIVEAKLRELSGEVTDIASSAVATASSHLDNVLAPLYDATDRVIKLTELADLEGLLQELCHMSPADSAALSTSASGLVSQACGLKAEDVLQLGGGVGQRSRHRGARRCGAQ